MNNPYFCKIYVLGQNIRVLLPPILTMMHLCIMIYMYWTPLPILMRIPMMC